MSAFEYITKKRRNSRNIKASAKVKACKPVAPFPFMGTFWQALFMHIQARLKNSRTAQLVEAEPSTMAVRL